MAFANFLRRALLFMLLISTVHANIVGILRTQVPFLFPLPKATNERPPILFGCFPHWSHSEKLLQLAAGLVEKGYPVTFMTGGLYKDFVRYFGAEYFEIPNSPTTPGFLLPDDEMKELMNLPPGSPEQQLHVIGKAFVQTIPRNFRAVQRALRKINDARTIYIQDMYFNAAQPLFRGAPGVKPHSVITIAPTPHGLPSNDTMPWNSGQQPDTSPNSRKIHWDAQVEQSSGAVHTGWAKMAREAWKEVRSQQPPPWPAMASSTLTDILCAMTIPDFEFPRSDLTTEVRFIGMTELVGVPDRKLPAWWDDVLAAKKAGKKIVAVSRSSIDLSTDALLVPAMEALKDRDDVVVVATLTNQDVEELTKVYTPPKNAHVARFIPMDLMLPDVDVLVTNAGYGTVQHALRNGVPLVLVGAGEDKGQTGVIVNYTGVGVYYHKNKFEASDVKASVDKILNDPSIGKVAQKMKETYASYHPVEALHEVIQERVRWYEDISTEKKTPRKDEL